MGSIGLAFLWQAAANGAQVVAPLWVFICVDRAQLHLLLPVQVSVLIPSSGSPLVSKGINKSLQSSLAPVVFQGKVHCFTLFHFKGLNLLSGSDLKLLEGRGVLLHPELWRNRNIR